MSQGNKPTYGAEEIRKYHSGELNAGQRHALERAALEDPFLADALEGYAFTSTPEADLESIRKRLSPRSKRRVIPVFMRAAVLILAVSGMLFLILREDKNPDTSISTIPSSPVPQTVPPPVPQNEGPTQQELADAEASPEVYNAKNKGRGNANTSASVRETNARKEETSTTAFKDAGTIAMQRRETAPPIDSSSAALVTESDVAINRVARSKEASRGDTIHVDVVLPENKAALSEVVVTSLGGKPRAYAPPDPKFETLEPTHGWATYNEYIAENIKGPEGEKKKKSSATGEVELQFDTNSFGEPENIKVTDSHCKSCEKEAVRLLKDGPKWQEGMKQRKIRIRF